MNEFNNRILAQRDTLKVVNSKKIFQEPLLSLSEKAINRWVINNRIDNKKSWVLLIKNISGKLFFLSNKSQEQITEDYRLLSINVTSLIEELDSAMANEAL